MEASSPDNLIQSFDFDTYAVIDPEDYSISIDVMAFEEVTEIEEYTFKLRGRSTVLRYKRMC